MELAKIIHVYQASNSYGMLGVGVLLGCILSVIGYAIPKRYFQPKPPPRKINLMLRITNAILYWQAKFVRGGTEDQIKSRMAEKNLDVVFYNDQIDSKLTQGVASGHYNMAFNRYTFPR